MNTTERQTITIKIKTSGKRKLPEAERKKKQKAILKYLSIFALLFIAIAVSVYLNFYQYNKHETELDNLYINRETMQELETELSEAKEYISYCQEEISDLQKETDPNREFVTGPIEASGEYFDIYIKE